MSSAAFVFIAILILAAALAAATLQKLMHATLSFAVALVGVAALFFLLSAEFVGLVLVFVYIGAVAVLIVFTILLTRRDVGKDRGANWGGALLAVAIFGGLTSAILKTQSVAIVAPHIRALGRGTRRGLTVVSDAFGAVIGKAMTSLAQGKTGMVLVLVNLQ